MPFLVNNKINGLRVYIPIIPKQKILRESRCLSIKNHKTDSMKKLISMRNCCNCLVYVLTSQIKTDNKLIIAAIKLRFIIVASIEFKYINPDKKKFKSKINNVT